jgi:ketose-bisphosphate aldolase
MIVNMKELLAGVDGYGVAAINVVDFTSMRSVVAAAERLRSPLIIQTSPKTVKHWSIDEMASWFQFLGKKASVPCVLHLDHCMDFDFIEACAKGGWTCVMYDGSALPFEENLANTKKVVAMAHALGVSVEGEIGAIGGVEDDKVVDDDDVQLADPKRAIQLAIEADLDVIAPAIGTAHGAYKKTPRVRFPILEEVSKGCDTPIALHGGTGLEDEVFHQCIQLGCKKVNISTQLKITGIDSVYDYIHEHRTEYNPLKVQEAQRTAYEQMAEGFMKLFKSDGKA